MDQTISSNTLAQSAPLFLEEYPGASDLWHALSGMIDGADGQDISVLAEQIDDLHTGLEEAETVWASFRDEIEKHSESMGKDQALEVARETAPYGFSIMDACIKNMNELHASLDRMLSEDSNEE